MAKWLKTTDNIQFEVRDRIARITLNRPEKRNALSDGLLGELADALLEADDLAEVNAVVLAGAGKDFCAGYDMAQNYGENSGQAAQAASYRATSGGSFDDDAARMERSQRKILTMFDLHKPVVVRVHGNCLAGGTDLAFMGDMVIAADNARIGFPATRAQGSPPTSMWVYHMGPQWAKRMLMTGDSLTGKDAARLGLVMDSAPADKLDAYVTEIARRLSMVDAEMLSTHKRAVNLALEMMGARTMQRVSVEMDARAHLVQGPRRAAFRKKRQEEGFKAALKLRDEPFGDGMVKFGKDF
jgi:enoyl-CoA hydratase